MWYTIINENLGPRRKGVEIKLIIMWNIHNIENVLKGKQFFLYVRFEVSTEVNMKIAVFCDVARSRFCVNCVSEEHIASIFKVEKSASEEPSGASGCSLKHQFFDWRLSLQPPAYAGSSLEDFSTLKMEAIISSEKSIHTISTRHHIL
jgi:hypothetical protein